MREHPTTKDPSIAANASLSPVRRALHAFPWDDADLALALGITAQQLALYRTAPAIIPMNARLLLMAFACETSAALKDQRLNDLGQLLRIECLGLIAHTMRDGSTDDVRATYRLRVHRALCEAMRGASMSTDEYTALLERLGIRSDRQLTQQRIHVEIPG